jgi:glycosyltransferase involved in cell wall biosynthesis
LLTLNAADAPYFSVIVPTYNRPLQLIMCLEALACLDYPPDRFEVVIVDDGSTTPLDTAVSSFRGKLDVTLIRQGRAGPAAARNAGAQRAKGTFLAFTDDDCMPRADWLQKLAARFAGTPGHIIGGRTLNALRDNPYSIASQLILEIVYSYYNQDHNHARFLASNNLAVSSERFQALGGFDSSFRTSEDRDLCDRWLHQGFTMTYASEAVVYHAHPLAFSTFWQQHFHYGCGAFHFHRMRARRGSGHLKPDAKFYLKALGQALRGNHPRKLMLPLLMIWCLANATGFFWRMAMPTNWTPK